MPSSFSNSLAVSLPGSALARAPSNSMTSVSMSEAPCVQSRPMGLQRENIGIV